MNALLLEVKTYCYNMLQKIKRAGVKDQWRGKIVIPGKFTLRKDRTATLQEYLDFALMENNEEVINYISGVVDHEVEAYGKQLEEMQAKLGKKS